MSKIRIAIVEDDVDWIKTLECFIGREDDMVVVGTASSREEAVNIARIQELDVILMDVNLSGNRHDGITAAVEISQLSTAKIVMLSCLKEDDVVIDSFTAGALYYICKENFKEIKNVIHCITNDFYPVKILLKEFFRLKRQDQLQELTAPEKEILALLEKGYRHSEIETQLFKSRNTIKTQIKSILKKFGARNTKEVLKKVRLNGLND